MCDFLVVFTLNLLNTAKLHPRPLGAKTEVGREKRAELEERFYGIVLVLLLSVGEDLGRDWAGLFVSNECKQAFVVNTKMLE